MWPDPEALLALLEPWVRTRRWFPVCDDLPLDVRGFVEYRDVGDTLSRSYVIGVGTTLLHLPLVLVASHEVVDQRAVIASVGEATVCDAVAHPAWLASCLGGAHLAPWITSSLSSPAIDAHHGQPHSATPHTMPWHATNSSAARQRSASTTPRHDGPTFDREALLAHCGQATVLDAEQSNTSVVLTDGVRHYLLKVYRVLHSGIHPDVEIGNALATWPHVAPPLAWATLDLAWTNARELNVSTHDLTALTDSPIDPSTLKGCVTKRDDDQWPQGHAVSCVLFPFVDGAVDGFTHFVDLASHNGDPSAQAHLLGSLVRELHQHLAARFPTEGSQEPRHLCAAIDAEFAALERDGVDLSPKVRSCLSRVIERLRHCDTFPERIRLHGDLHLGQLLCADTWYVVDFEGEVLRPLEERRQCDYAMRDVAGMLRSFDYAQAHAFAVIDHANTSQTQAHTPSTATHDCAPTPDRKNLNLGHLCSSDDSLAERDDTWCTRAQTAFLDGYTRGGGLSQIESTLLDAYVVHKAIYEARYEARFRPEWVDIPVRALERYAQALCQSGTIFQ
ncbi:hypothetical protein [Schaalia suimastitidis]|uniref:hypothetical protein n=1 Tax=Schaalia suimastitidis TaxID=121163 RepID=UPI0004197AF2|nr:hypothetical protein [Schaalia suimastitidis]